MRDIEFPFFFADSDRYDAIAALSTIDYRRLVRILMRARLARSVGIHVPLDKLLQESPL
jgi:hypothetical protein